MDTNSANSFNLTPGDRSVVSVTSGHAAISSDLLHQAFQEVAHHQSQEVKLEPEPGPGAGVYNTMEQLMSSAPMQPLPDVTEAAVVPEVKVVRLVKVLC